MWFRFLVLSFLNVVAVAASVIVIAGFVFPSSWPAWMLMICIWIVAFLMAFFFANWALSTRLPNGQDTLHLVAMHLFAFVTLYLAYGTFISDRGPWVIASPELLAQLAIEIAAVFLSSYRMRRQKIKAVLGEGMTM